MKHCSSLFVLYCRNCPKDDATRQNVSKLAAFRRGAGHLEPRFQGEGVVPGQYFWFLQN